MRQGDDSDDDSDNRATYSPDIAMLAFRISSHAFGTRKGEDFRDFCFLRQMKPADRQEKASFPSPRVSAGRPMTSSRTKPQAWASQDVGSAGPPTSLQGTRRQGRAIMPYWQGGTAKWSISTGVYESKLLMDNRTRPPYIRRCPCSGPALRHKTA